MSTEKGPAVRTGGLGGGGFTYGWRLLNEITEKPQEYGELVQLYGDGLRTFDIMMWAKNYIDISTREQLVLEEGSFWDTLDTAAQVSTSAAGENITITSLKGIGRVNFNVHIQPAYSGTKVAVSYNIQSKSYNAGTGIYTYTCKPLMDTFQIAVAIPASTPLIVGGYQGAAGSQQPEGLTQGFYSHTHTSRIIKETINFEGGQNAILERDALGQSQYGSSLKARELVKAQLRANHQINDAILMGYPNTNSLTQLNRGGDSNPVFGDYGLIPAMYNDAMKQYYTGSYTEDNFDTLKFLFASQGITGGSAMFLLGQELGLSIENSGLKFLKEYSGGSDLYDNLKGIGFGIKEVFKNNFKTYLTEVQEFNNPVTYAADGYNFESLGMIFHDSKITATLNGINPGGMNAAGKKVSLGHMTLGYLNHGGENRKMIVANRAGVNGMGIPTSDDWDDSATYMLSEFMLLLLGLNRSILVLRT